MGCPSQCYRFRKVDASENTAVFKNQSYCMLPRKNDSLEIYLLFLLKGFLL